MPVALDVRADCELPLEVKIAFFRIAQEALNNVAKHAEASQASLSFTCRSSNQSAAGEVVLCVCDDGLGFLSEETAPDHLGLDIMRERAEAIGAALTIDSRPGQGVRVTAIWRAAESEQL